MLSWGWGRCRVGGGGMESRRKLLEGSVVRTFHFHCFRWLVFSEPFPWRCRSPDRWPLCRYCSCNTEKHFNFNTQSQKKKERLKLVCLCFYTVTLTFDLIHSACRACSVLQRKRKSTSGQSLASQVLRRTKWLLKGFLFLLFLVQGRFHIFTFSHVNSKWSPVRFHTWGVWNDLSCVLSTATRAVAWGGPEAPWNTDTVNFLLMTDSRI